MNTRSNSLESPMTYRDRDGNERLTHSHLEDPLGYPGTLWRKDHVDFHDNLHELDSSTAYRLAHAANLAGEDTYRRVENITLAYSQTVRDDDLDEKSKQELATDITDGMTAFSRRHRDQLEFISDHANYQVPKTPRQQQLDYFEQSLIGRGLEYIKNDKGDITVTFPTPRIRDQILGDVPKGFARPVTKQELEHHQEGLTLQRELQSTYVFQAQDEQEMLQLIGQKYELDAKRRRDEIASLLEQSTDDGDPDKVVDDITKHLRDQYEDDSKTIAERLMHLPLPDPTANYSLQEINSWTDPDMRVYLHELKAYAAFQNAEHAASDHPPHSYQHRIADHMSDAYKHYLNLFADRGDGPQYAELQQHYLDGGEPSTTS